MIVGDNDITRVLQSYATGAISGGSNVGGLVGYNDGMVRKSSANVTVSGSSDVGGLVGLDNSGEVSQSYWDMETTGQPSSAGGGTGLTTTEMTGAAAATNMDGFGFTSRFASWVLTDSYPRLLRNLDALSLTTADVTLPVGGQTQATVTASFTDGTTETATTVADYNSSDTTVATVADDGVISGIASGDATLTATLATLSDTAVITVDGIDPIAKAKSDQPGLTGEPITFDASNSTDNVGIKSYTWDFGDGTAKKTVTDPITTHVYTKPSKYEVTLTVTDLVGNTDTDTLLVRVCGPPSEKGKAPPSPCDEPQRDESSGSDSVTSSPLAERFSD